MATATREKNDEPGEGDRLTPRLAPITHQTLYERVYAELRSAIMSGAFAPSETLTIRGLADQLGTSVMPAREALRRLSSEGAVDVLPNRSIRIPPMNESRIEEICRIRLLLEGEAAGLAALRVTPQEVEAIRALNRDFIEHAKSDAVPQLLHANQQFHFAIYEAAKSPTILSIIGMLWLQTGPWLLEPLRRVLNKGASRDYIETSIAHHQKLIDGLAEGRAEQAAAAVRADIRDAAARFRAFIGPVPAKPRSVAR
jgi:DNA-binding GntR family transcriptional regulator